MHVRIESFSKGLRHVDSRLVRHDNGFMDVIRVLSPETCFEQTLYGKQ